MADQDYPHLYEEMEDSAQRTRAAAIAFEHVLGGPEADMVPVNGYPAQPTIAGRVKSRLDPLVATAEGDFAELINEVQERVDGIVDTVESAAESVKRFAGVHATAPATRYDGSPLQPGDEYQNSTEGLRYSWSGSAWVVLNASVQQLTQKLSDPVAAENGAGMVGYKGRTLQDKLSDVVCIQDAPWSAKPDGSDQSAAFADFHEYVMANGLVGDYGPGEFNVGAFRVKRITTEGPVKPFKFRGRGWDTVLKLGNIDPVFTPGQKGVNNEPHLFHLLGETETKTPFPSGFFEDFTVDYSNQRYKGGADPSTPELTDIDPISLGMKLFCVEYGHVEIRRVYARNVYGEFYFFNRSPWCVVHDCRAFDVSGGNIGRADSNGAFGMALRGSATGASIKGNIAINSRVYKTDTIRGFTDRSAKDTPCGYIGICLEYGNFVGGAPSVDRDLWLNAGKPNLSTLKADVAGNWMHGYYIGYKTETDVSFSIHNNISTCCWMPFLCSTSSKGDVTANEYDRGYLDDLIQPMGGFRYVQGGFTHLTYDVSQQDTPDVVFDKNVCMARNGFPAFTTNCNNSKFLNQITTMDGPGPIAMTRTDRPVTGLEVTGSVLIKNMTQDYSTTIVDCPGAKFDLKIVNTSPFAYRMLIGRFWEPILENSVSVRLATEGLVGIDFRDCTPAPFIGNFSLLDTALSFAGTADTSRFFSVNGAYGGKVEARINTHSRAIQSGELANVYMGGGSVELDLNIRDAGSNQITSALRVGAVNGYSSPDSTVRVHTDSYAIPLISYFTRFSHSLRIKEAHGKGPIFLGDTNFGPVYLPQFYEATQISNTGTSEPNSLTRLRKSTANDGDAHYVQGVRSPYLRTSQNGKNGILCTASGWLANEWAASTSVAVNEYRQVKATARVYRCTVAGTTGAVAPSHTSGTADDGTVTWQYIGPMAQFAEYGSIGPNL